MKTKTARNNCEIYLQFTSKNIAETKKSIHGLLDVSDEFKSKKIECLTNAISGEVWYRSCIALQSNDF